MKNERIRAMSESYRQQLGTLRREWDGVYELPEAHFFLFGMGRRRKLVYQYGELRDALSGEVLRRWTVKAESIIPPAYTVELETTAGERVVIYEDEDGVWLEEGERQIPLSEPATLRLPLFEGQPYGMVLRVLHQEILVNIQAGLPVPNFFVYPRPWYRDAAMMAMVLRETGNLEQIREWVLGLDDPYDHNNGNAEPDNLGQALFLQSLFGARDHPLVGRALAEVEQFQRGEYIVGITDGREHPVYQTHWLKLGLRALGLPDPYQIPRVADDYAALCWWGEKDVHIEVERALSGDYPYLTWAADIYYWEKNGMVGNCDYPLSWEANASQADYGGIAGLAGEYAERRLAAPHTWHAAEMFMRLREEG